MARRRTIERILGSAGATRGQRLVVDDLAAATAFLVELGPELQGAGPPRAVGWTAWWGSTAVLASLRARGAELVGKVGRDKDSYRLCYVRGPEGIIVDLAEQIG